MRVRWVRHELQAVTGRPAAMVDLVASEEDCPLYETGISADGDIEMHPKELFDRVVEATAHRVEIGGGAPLAEAEIPALLESLLDESLELWLRLSGRIDYRQLDPRIRRIIDWKCPGSGLTPHNHPDWLSALGERDVLSCRLTDRHDYEWARHQILSFALPCPIMFGGVTSQLASAAVRDWVLADDLNVRVLAG